MRSRGSVLRLRLVSRHAVNASTARRVESGPHVAAVRPVVPEPDATGTPCPSSVQRAGPHAGSPSAAAPADARDAPPSLALSAGTAAFPAAVAFSLPAPASSEVVRRGSPPRCWLVEAGEQRWPRSCAGCSQAVAAQRARLESACAPRSQSTEPYRSVACSWTAPFWQSLRAVPDDLPLAHASQSAASALQLADGLPLPPLQWHVESD